MKTTKNPGRLASGILATALVATLGLGIVGCDSTPSSSTDGSDTAQSEQQAAGDALAAPSDLTIDFATGDFTFTANDADMGYYFLRVYTNTDGVQGDEYVATSSRMAGGSTGEVKGKVDLSELGWSTYNFNLIGYAASGSDREAPAPQTFTYQLGVGGVMERPELLVLTDGSEAECYIDLYTMSDWYKFQRMPEVEFNVYADEACTEVVKTETVDLSDMAPQAASGPWATGTNWATDADAAHKYLQPAEGGGQQMGPMSAPSEPTGLVSQLVLSDLEPGTYYVTATAKGTSDGSISDSQPSEAVAFTVTADAPTGEFVAAKTSLWQDPVLGGMGATAAEGTYTDRVDFAKSQVTSGTLVS